MLTTSPSPAAPKLLDRVRQAVRTRGYSLRTEETYVYWVRRFILFHGKRHPAELGVEGVTAFLSDLAVRMHVAPSTQNQARAALLFLFSKVLEIELPWLDEVVIAKRRRYLPVVLTHTEVRALLHEMGGTTGMVSTLLK